MQPCIAADLGVGKQPPLRHTRAILDPALNATPRLAAVVAMSWFNGVIRANTTISQDGATSTATGSFAGIATTLTLAWAQGQASVTAVSATDVSMSPALSTLFAGVPTPQVVTDAMALRLQALSARFIDGESQGLGLGSCAVAVAFKLDPLAWRRDRAPALRGSCNRQNGARCPGIDLAPRRALIHHGGPHNRRLDCADWA